MYEERVAELCNDYDIETASGYELLPKIAYTNALSSALAFYIKAKPRYATFIARPNAQRYIEIPTTLNPPFRGEKGAKIESIEFINRDPNATDLYEKQAMVSLVRRDVYVVEYSDELGKWVIKFIGKVTGTYRVKYTYEISLNEMDTLLSDEIEGLIYLAGGFACDKIAAKFARVFTQKIPADLQAFRDKVNYYRELSDELKAMGYNILDINEETGTMAYSTWASWGVRKVRRII